MHRIFFLSHEHVFFHDLFSAWVIYTIDIYIYTYNPQINRISKTKLDENNVDIK